MTTYLALADTLAIPTGDYAWPTLILALSAQWAAVAVAVFGHKKRTKAAHRTNTENGPEKSGSVTSAPDSLPV